MCRRVEITESLLRSNLESCVLKKLLEDSQEEIPIIQECEESPMDYIDKKFAQIEADKIVENLKIIIRKEIQSALSNHKSKVDYSESFDYNGNSKLVFTLENHIMFMEEEMRRKNIIIEHLLQSTNKKSETDSVIRKGVNFLSQDSTNLNCDQNLKNM
jgi:hypothetical protein